MQNSRIDSLALWVLLMLLLMIPVALELLRLE
jgi:hypothetical protein